MRESLRAAFGDPLQNFSTPKAIRHLSQEIADGAAVIEGRLRKASTSSDEHIGTQPNKTEQYLDQREELVHDMDKFLQTARRIANTALNKLALREPEKKEMKQLAELERVILRERSALASERTRLKYNMLGRPGSTKLGEAYMMAITEGLPAPQHAAYPKIGGRSGTDQTAFRHRLIKRYHVNGEELSQSQFSQSQQPLWCQISHKWMDEQAVAAAHIIPCAIGEVTAAYVFGGDPMDGYKFIWSEKNGLMIHKNLEKAFDNGQLVVVPDPDEANEFITILLDKTLFQQECVQIGQPWGQLHKRRLVFQTDARPGKRFLYFHTLLTIFRRRRYAVPGWESDKEEVFGGKIWASPGRWVRKSMIKALAVEVGDCWEDIGSVVEEVGGLVDDFPNPQTLEQEERSATAASCSLLGDWSNAELS